MLPASTVAGRASRAGTTLHPKAWRRRAGSRPGALIATPKCRAPIKLRITARNPPAHPDQAGVMRIEVGQHGQAAGRQAAIAEPGHMAGARLGGSRGESGWARKPRQASLV